MNRGSRSRWIWLTKKITDHGSRVTAKISDRRNLGRGRAFDVAGESGRRAVRAVFWWIVVGSREFEFMIRYGSSNSKNSSWLIQKLGGPPGGDLLDHWNYNYQNGKSVSRRAYCWLSRGILFMEGRHCSSRDNFDVPIIPNCVSELGSEPVRNRFGFHYA